MICPVAVAPGPTTGPSALPISSDQLAVARLPLFTQALDFSDDLTATIRATNAYSYGAFEAIEGAPNPEAEDNEFSLPAAINWGGDAWLTKDGTLYDANYSGNDSSTVTRMHAVSGTSDDSLYQFARHGPSNYTIPVENGNYLITLMRSGTYWNGRGSGNWIAFLGTKGNRSARYLSKRWI